MYKYEGTVYGQHGPHYMDLSCVHCPVCHEVMEIANDSTWKTDEKNDFFLEKCGKDEFVAARRQEENFHVTLRCPECRTELNTDFDTVEIITD